MTWIRTLTPNDASPELRQCFEEIKALLPPEYQEEVPAVVRPDGSADSISAAHSLIPQAMRHIMAAYVALLSPRLPLSRRQQEMIATVVSALNRCFY